MLKVWSSGECTMDMMKYSAITFGSLFVLWASICSGTIELIG